MISKDRLKPDPDKVAAIKNMPKPTSKSEVLTLLGFVNYLSKFLHKLSDASAPLRELTSNQAQFTWATHHNKAFTAIQQLVIQHPVLKFYDVNEEVTIQTDASNKGLGALLTQNGQPVAFASRALSNRAEICNHRERMPRNRFLPVKDLTNTWHVERKCQWKLTINLLSPYSRSRCYQHLVVCRGCYSGFSDTHTHAYIHTLFVKAGWFAAI